MGVTRRDLLRGGMAAGAAAALGACADDRAEPSPGGGEVVAHPASFNYLSPAGPHQIGITDTSGSYGILAAFRSTAADQAELSSTFQTLGAEVHRLMTGQPYEDRDRAYPPLYTGHVGNPAPAANLAVVVSVGASLFDQRYGLAARRPRDLQTMPFLANDKLDPARSHGDVLLSISSAHEDVNLFALRQLARVTRGTLTMHWMLQGYNRRTAAQPGEAGVRNLMGFVDGTANLHGDDATMMGSHVWVQAGDGEPDWATDGTYHVVRVIRMFVEFWDRTRLSEQEALIGRRKLDGAPLGGNRETDLPDYASDPDGKVTPLTAHIRLANPRRTTTDADLIFRRGLSFSRGFDADGHLDQGLAFVSFQRRMSQFLNTQARLKGEPLEEYIEPQGGGFYFALPGPTDGRWLGQGLFS
jgi:deferrochelatase/peroxidase EfeB